MPRCPHCSQPATDASRFCPHCGASLSPASSLTVTTPSTPAAGVAPDSRAARFIPGTILMNRYRVVALLGSGGMGEVYRADDLKLGQTVALKFLPVPLEQDPERLESLLNEVRTARAVSHPNVCRVYDVDEVDGSHFISMEFVDGEDLASLLRRIGRLPTGKALDIARQLCAGLDAAHDQGVLHRDLKPSNVMIDGRGRARIPDFGVAALMGKAGSLGGTHGTPAYMAPEVLAGHDATARSDIFALGLILYEIFTGRRAYTADSREQLARLYDGAPPAAPSSIVPDIDAATDRLILECLERTPSLRPHSAIAVAASLPGSDPLAAALAAGETPSPELVAASGGEGRLPGAAGISLLGATLALLVLGVILAAKVELTAFLPLDRHPAVLAERAREIARELRGGEPARRAHEVSGFLSDLYYVEHTLARDSTSARWSRLRAERPLAVLFWYRQSEKPIVARNPWGVIGPGDPPRGSPGVTTIRLDLTGRLLSYEAAPPSRVDSAAAAGGMEASPDSADWTRLFALADLDPVAFREREPRVTPAFYVEDRREWVGTLPSSGGIPVEIAAGSTRARVTSFRLVFPWDAKRGEIVSLGGGGWAVAIAAMVVLLGIALGSVALAIRHLRAGRGDRRGATRLAVYGFGLTLASGLLTIDHTATIQEIFPVIHAIGWSLLVAGLIWSLYLALEPFARRVYPALLISWNRLLTGRFRDPVVSRDILVGALFGVATFAVQAWGAWQTPRLDMAPGPEVPLSALDLDIARGAARFVAMVFGGLAGVIAASIGSLLVLVGLRFLLRRAWIAVAVFTGVFVIASVPWASLGNWAIWVSNLAGIALSLTCLLRYGLLASIVESGAEGLLLHTPLTTNPSSWLAPTTMVTVGIILVMATYGYWHSRPRSFTALSGRTPSG